MSQEGSTVELLPQRADEDDTTAPETWTESTAQHLLLALFRFRLVQRRMTADLQQRAGVSESDLGALALLARRSPASISELAQALDLTPGSTSSLVDRLARGGMVERTLSPADRRVSQVVATPHGESLLKVARVHYLTALERALASCTDDCFHTTARVLDALGDAITALLDHGPDGDPARSGDRVVHAVETAPHGVLDRTRAAV